MPLTFKSKPSLLITFEDDVLDHMGAYRQTNCFRREAGGQLFAKVTSHAWVVCVATGPRKSDFRSRFGYRPHRAAEQEEIDRFFKQGLHFVGDWHTHPQAKPSPSDTDIWSMNDTVSRSEHSLVGMLLTIVGTLPFPEGLWVSMHSGIGRSPVRLGEEKHGIA